MNKTYLVLWENFLVKNQLELNVFYTYKQAKNYKKFLLEIGTKNIKIVKVNSPVVRLTERFNVITAVDKSGIENHSKGIKLKQGADEKLCQLEDIEEELGIDLITLFKALKHGVYYKYKDMGVEKISKLRPITIRKNTVVCDYHTYKYFKDYGKTWALTKEELE